MEPYSHANIILEELIICVSLHLMKNVLCNNAPNIFKEEHSRIAYSSHKSVFVLF